MFRRIPLIIAALSLVLAACGDAGGAQRTPQEVGDTTTAPLGTEAETDTEPETDTEAASITLVTSVFPLAWMAQEIAPDAEVILLASSGQDPHDLEMSPAQRVQIESADIVAYMGQIDFQPQVESAVGAATGVVVSVADIAADDVIHMDAHSHDDDAHDDDDEHDHRHDEDAHDDDAHDDDAHDEGHDDAHDDEGVDPHIWFDPAVMAEVAQELGEAFATVDEARAEAYRSNADQVHGDLLTLEAQIDDLLSGCLHDTAIVSHEAYAYLLGPRGLHQEGISGAGGHGEASPQRLATLTERIRSEGIPAVLAEPLEGRADAQALAAEAGVDMLDIDPLEIADAGHFEAGYLELLREQTQTFARALECE